jgi:hypothetical protein
MEGLPVTETAHPLPRASAVFVEQLRVVGLAVRREAFLLTIVLTVLGFLVLLEAWGDRDQVPAVPMPPVLMIVLGALSPFAVWKGERVFGGGHLWTLPVERRRHALTKVLAGGVWLLVAVVGLHLWMLGVGLATGGGIGEQQTRMLVGPGGAGDLTPVEWSTPAWEWAVPFSVAITCYLIGSAFILAVKHPLRWGAAAVASFIGLQLLSELHVTAGVANAVMNTVVESPLGLDRALGGGEADETEALTGREDAMGLGPEVLVLWSRFPSLNDYAPAALFWFALAAAAVWIAASRHREN